MAKIYSCRKCSKGGFASAGAVAAHAREAGHPRAQKKPAANTPPPQDRERGLLGDIAERFDAELQAEELDSDAYNRVLGYLTQRYGTPVEDAA